MSAPELCDPVDIADVEPSVEQSHTDPNMANENVDTDTDVITLAAARTTTPFPVYQPRRFTTDELPKDRRPKCEKVQILSRRSKDLYGPTGLIYSLISLDIGGSLTLSVKAYGSERAADRFTSTLEVGGDTKMNEATMSWLEMNRFKDMQWGAWSTTDVEISPLPPLPKTNKRIITFARPFYYDPPKVVVFLTGIDVDNKFNCRVDTYADGVTATGFVLHVDTWGDTKLLRADVNWVAHPGNTASIDSGKYQVNKTTVTPNPLEHSSKVVFKRRFPSGPPFMFLGLSHLDFDKTKNLRVRLSSRDIQPDSWNWLISTSGDSKMYGVKASFIAWEPGLY